jgi:hypothetical protein
MRVCFVVPCHGRHALAQACLRELARTCAALAEEGLDASAILAGDDRFFARLADELGFGYMPSPNRPLGRKWNDAIEFACREGAADYVIPFGSDDLIDPQLILSAPLPAEREVRCSRLSSVVDPRGARLATLEIPYRGGDGVRIIPAALLERVRFRPAGEDRERGIDGSIFDQLNRSGDGPRYVYHDLDPLQIIDCKSGDGSQRNSYQSCLEFATAEHDDPWGLLADRGYRVDEIRAAYPRQRVAA